MLANNLGKKNCFECGGNNHLVINYPDLTDVQCEELAGMAHISIGNKELEEIGFLQNEFSHPCIVATCKTLSPQHLYLNSMFSFYQVFIEDHLDHLCLVGTTLCADCNVGTNFATEKG
jgi:hypothetical protein